MTIDQSQDTVTKGLAVEIHNTISRACYQLDLEHYGRFLRQLEARCKEEAEVVEADLLKTQNKIHESGS